jgi:Arc/MetJ-type ribon-helix-helix transcriptional regulator
MTIRLPEDLQRYVHDQVQAGRFLSEDDVVTDALNRHRQAQITPPAVLPSIDPTPGSMHEDAGLHGEIAAAAMNRKPIWEVVEELRKSVPPEEFAKLPRDGAEQLDHYLYGSPKRPTA